MNASSDASLYDSADDPLSALGLSAPLDLEAHESQTMGEWNTIFIPEPLGSAHRETRYPNTPLAVLWLANASEQYLLVGLLSAPTLLKILPPKISVVDDLGGGRLGRTRGRFNVLPLDAQRFLLCDESSHVIYVIHPKSKQKTVLAGCGKRGYMDGLR
jgi:hypothetical protein